MQSIEQELKLIKRKLANREAKIVRQRAMLKYKEYKNHLQRRLFFAKGYKQCIAEHGKAKKPKPQKIKIQKVRVVKKVIKEKIVTVPTVPKTYEISNLALNLVHVRNFCNDADITLPAFIIFLVICCVENPNSVKVRKFGVSNSHFFILLKVLIERGLVEVFTETRPKAIRPSLKGQKLFSSFNEFYGKIGTTRRRPTNSGVG